MRSALCALLLAGCTALSGCAVAALPVLAGGLMTRQVATEDGDAKADPASAVVVPAPETTAFVPASASPVAGAEPVIEPGANLTEAYVAMALFAIERAGAPERLSVLPDPGASEESEFLRPCAGQPAAVLIDLDPGEAALDPNAAKLTARAGLAPALETLRADGVAVLWTSVLDESRAGDVRRALATSGLDPAGGDTLLLTRDPAETKTHRRDAVAEEWCITAIVGDRDGDFDMLLDYLRDPSAPTPFDPLFGNGWFELPPPLASAA